mgnify:CR=1 FL=1
MASANIHDYIAPGRRAHLVGIGGVSMAPLAEVLHGAGMVITGSDRQESAAVTHLRSLGIQVTIGHLPESARGADCVIYAGSLVNPALLGLCRDSARIYDSARMTLEQVLEVLEETHRRGGDTVRLHTGDPCLYGAIREQMDALDTLGIAYEVIPGVSSFLAAAASMKKEYTLPGVSQTVILSRLEGRTPVPEKEKILSLAKHHATMIIFLSVGKIEVLVKLIGTSYEKDTPVAVVYKASWPEEVIIYGTLETIAEKVKAAGITKTALVVVGDFLGDKYELSKLYDQNFETEYRKTGDSIDDSHQ